jgi:hypothetical protein
MKNSQNYIRITTLSAAAMLLATPALAQSTDKERSDSPTVIEQSKSDQDTVMEQKPAPDAKSDATDAQNTDATAETTIHLGQVVWSSDGKELGKVSKVNLDAAGKMESIYFNVGSTLGFGGKTVMSEIANFSQNNDRIELKADAKAAKALPEIKS